MRKSVPSWWLQYIAQRSRSACMVKGAVTPYQKKAQYQVNILFSTCLLRGVRRLRIRDGSPLNSGFICVFRHVNSNSVVRHVQLPVKSRCAAYETTPRTNDMTTSSWPSRAKIRKPKRFLLKMTSTLHNEAAQQRGKINMSKFPITVLHSWYYRTKLPRVQLST